MENKFIAGKLYVLKPHNISIHGTGLYWVTNTESSLFCITGDVYKEFQLSANSVIMCLDSSPSCNLTKNVRFLFKSNEIKIGYTYYDIIMQVDYFFKHWKII